MAKSVDAEDKPNTIDQTKLERYVKEIERHHDELLNKRMSYMASCRPVRENIADVYKIAYEDLRIPKKVLRAKIRERALQREIDGIADDFEEDDCDTFEQVSQALGAFGDTPLGSAAKQAAAKADAAPKRGPGRPRKASSADAAGETATAPDDDGEPDLRSDAQKLAERDREEEAARVSAENAEKLQKGISQLN